MAMSKAANDRLCVHSLSSKALVAAYFAIQTDRMFILKVGNMTVITIKDV